MRVHAIIPAKRLGNSKTRLSRVLSSDQRKLLGLSMLEDVLAAVTSSRLIEKTVVVTSDSLVRSTAKKYGAQPLMETVETGVNDAVTLGFKSCAADGADAVLILPTDIPLTVTYDVDGVVELGRRGVRVVIGPSLRFDGTNVLFLNPPTAIPLSYDMDSFRNHLQSAKHLKTAVYLSWGTMLDIDSPTDMALLMKTPRTTRTHRTLKQWRNQLVARRSKNIWQRAAA